MNEKHQKLKEKLTTISVAVSLLVTIGGVAIGIFNYLTLNQLAPLSTRITQIEANEGTIKDELVIYKTNQAELLNKLATKQQVDDVIVRVDRISARLDGLISILVK